MFREVLLEGECNIFFTERKQRKSFIKSKKKEVVSVKEASYYEKGADKAVRCRLCPNNCVIHEGEIGICRVRENINGKLFSKVYGKISALNLDRIEKKPFYHFFPGKKIATIGSYGCNLSCTYCQNYQISQQNGDKSLYSEVSPEELVNKISQVEDNLGIAFSYNEPAIFFEFMRDIAIKAKKRGMKTAMVTNGYINMEPLVESFSFIDAYSIDLKSFNEKFYKGICRGKLEPVKSVIEAVAKAGKHLEIENLVIPEEERDYHEFEEMTKWISSKCGEDVPLHINNYHPDYKMSTPPEDFEILEKLREIAIKYLNYVYIGNIEAGKYENTICPECGKEAILRRGYFDSQVVGCNEEGRCINCKRKIFINS